jgi:hypothetical protein
MPARAGNLAQGGKGPRMAADLVALIPPLIAGGAFLTAVIIFLRHQMGPPRRRADGGGGAGISDEGVNDDPGTAPPVCAADQGEGSASHQQGIASCGEQQANRKR